MGIYINDQGYFRKKYYEENKSVFCLKMAKE